ncbi:hypothetical protein DWX22_03275 [Coprococcus sp. AF18-48]|nr:hypothetical protein DWX22_03275 [Coprococcus sp. AF18-48]
MFEVKIFIETSLKGPLRTGEGAGWYAAVAEYRRKNGEIETREVFVCEEKTTYHKSTLSALLKVLKILNKACVLQIRTDSSYLVSNYQNGNLEMWKSRDFKNCKGEEIKNRELWEQVSAELDKHEVEMIRERRHEYSEWMRQQAKERFQKQENVENTEIGGRLHE